MRAKSQQRLERLRKLPRQWNAQCASSTDQTAKIGDEEAQEREEELMYLRERVEEYATEIERLRNEGLHRESEKRKLAENSLEAGKKGGLSNALDHTAKKHHAAGVRLQ